MFKKSFLKLSSPLTVSTAAMMIAVYVAFYAIKLPIALESRMSLTFLPLMLAAYLLGPVPAMIVGAVGDILSFVFFPNGQYFPGFTVSAILSGLIYGVLLYHKTGDIRGRVIAAATLVVFLVNMCLNTLWLSIMYEKAFIVFLGTRVFLNLIEVPVMILLGIIILDVTKKTGIIKKYISEN